jgi:predicted RNA binding protein YcfA (HicA-like mRNA interferase family)
VSRKYPVLSARDVVRVLRRNGFTLAGQAGSHQKWRNRNGKQVIVPVHGAKQIPIGTLRSIIDGSGIDVDAFR